MISRLFGAIIVLMLLLAPPTATAGPIFPTVLSGNTTGMGDAFFTGPPDDTFVGIGSRDVTYDFGPFLVQNRPGVDLNVYEVDWGVPEFEYMDILVSVDNVVYTSIWASGIPLVNANRIPGDSAHGDNAFGRSYDLGVFDNIRYVRIDGLGLADAGGTSYFDLDAIGAHEAGAVVSVPEPGPSVLLLAGLAAVMARLARRRR